MVSRSAVLHTVERGYRKWLLEAGLVVGGAMIGLAVFVNPSLAVAGVVGLAIVGFVALAVEALPVFLVTTIFIESVAAGPGLRIGRLAAVLSVAVVVYYLLAGGKTTLRINALFLVAAAYGVWIVASFYWADDHDLVIKTMGQYGLAFAYMLAFAALVRRREQFRSIFLALVVGSVVFGLASFIVNTGSLAGYRFSGLQGGANFFALYQLMVLPPALMLAASDKRPERKPLYYAVVGFLAVSIVLSQSRMGLIVFSVMALLMLVLPIRFFFARVGDKFSYAGFLLLIAALVATAAPAGFLKRASTILTAVNPQGDQGSGRLDLWRAAWTAFHENELRGLGAGNFYAQAVEFMQRTPGVRSEFIAYSASLKGRPAHSIYLDSLADLGIVGLALVVLLLALSGRYLWLSFRRARAAQDLELERFAVTLMILLAATATGGVFLSIQFGKILWIIVGLALALDGVTSRLAQAEPTVQSAAVRAWPTRSAGRRRRPESS